jgi:hypothetical protein
LWDFAVFFSNHLFEFSRGDHVRRAPAHREATPTAGLASAAAVSLEAAAAFVFAEVDESEFANWHGDVTRYLLLHDLLFFHHAHGLALDLLELELDFLLDNGLLDHPDLLHAFLDRLHESFLDGHHLLDYADFWPLHHLLDHLDYRLCLFFLPDDGLLHFNCLHLVADLCFTLGLFLQN